MGKTKEMIADFRRQGHTHVGIHIHGEPVEIVSWYKYLDTILEDTLKWDLNTDHHKQRAPATPSVADAQIC